MKAYGCKFIFTIQVYWDRSRHILQSPAIRPTVNIEDISGLERPNYNHM